MERTAGALAIETNILHKEKKIRKIYLFETIKNDLQITESKVKATSKVSVHVNCVYEAN